jgi:hypothetical protein
MHPQDHAEGRRTLRARLGRSVRTRSVVAATGMLVVGITATGVAATGSGLLEGKRNGTATEETQFIADIKATTNAAGTGGYSTRQSNLSSTGGGAIYGCRSTAGGSQAKPPTYPCIRANNLSTGFAFEFNAAAGLVGGQITVGKGGDSTKPFTTNATGVATGLNADRVDGQDAAAIQKAATDAAVAAAATDATTKANAAKSRWLLVNAAGEIEAQSGGFKIIVAYPQGTGAAPNVYIDAGEDLSNNGITATLALQNQVNQGGNTATGNDAAADQNLEFSGEISTSRCQIPGVVECGPAAAKTVNAFVVSPRLSDGQPTAADSRKRFYVQITG